MSGDSFQEISGNVFPCIIFGARSPLKEILAEADAPVDDGITGPSVLET